mgnify:CR=1 FL=1
MGHEGLRREDPAPASQPDAPERETLSRAELQQWAAAYAQSITAAADQTEREFVLFRLGEERFAAPIEDLDEVASVSGGIALAHASPVLLGLTNLRGEILPLLDTGALLEAPAAISIGTGNRTLVVRDRRGRRSGLPVDAVLGVANLDPADFRLYPARQGRGLIARVGLAEHAGGALTLVDLSPLQRESCDAFS